MTDNDNELLYPKSASKEIAFMLRNYKNIDNLIEERRTNIMDRMNGSTSAWLKGINQSSNSFEDIIILLDEDKVIKRYKHWKSFFASFFKILKIYERPIFYKFVELKYFNNLENEEITEKLNIDNKSLKELKNDFLWLIYQYAIKDNLYQREVQNSVAV